MKTVHAWLGLFLMAAGVPAEGAGKPVENTDPRARPAVMAVPEKSKEQKAAQQFHDEALKAFSRGDLETAKLGFLKVLVLSPENAPARINLALVEQRQRHYAAAEQHLRAVLKNDLENAAAWLLLGIGAYEQEKLDAAHAHLAQAVLFAPKDARAHHYLGITFSRRAWYSAGEEELRRAVELDPKLADAHYNLAVLYMERTPPANELAHRHYQLALELGAAPDARLARRLGN